MLALLAFRVTPPSHTRAAPADGKPEAAKTTATFPPLTCWSCCGTAQNGQRTRQRAEGTEADPVGRDDLPRCSCPQAAAPVAAAALGHPAPPAARRGPRSARRGRHLPRDLDRARAEAGDQERLRPLPHVRPDGRGGAARRARDDAAVRALGPLQRPRSAPRLLARRGVAVPGDARDPGLRRRAGDGVLVLLHLLRQPDLRPHLRVGVPLGLRPRGRRRAARDGLPPPRRARRLRIADRRRGARARRRPAPAARPDRFRIDHAARRQRAEGPRPARAARGALRQHRRGADHRPGLPAGAGCRPRGPLPPARRARPRGALDDGDPDGPGGVRPRPDAPAVRAQAARVRGHRLHRQARVRHRDGGSARACCSRPCSCSRRWPSRSPRAVP